MKPPPSSISVREFYLNALELMTAMARIALAIRDHVISAGERVERQYRRRQLLAAYKHRSSWKKSDIQSLKKLGASSAALRRAGGMRGRGRPIVKQPHSLYEVFYNRFLELRPLFDPNSSTEERKKSFKLWPWYQHHVEALYRGEKRLAKKGCTKGSPADIAERLIGEILGISQAKVHAICQNVRNNRKDSPDEDNFPEITLAEYESWMATGKGPHLDKD